MKTSVEDFVALHPDTAMITLRADGTAHMARIEVAMVDGKLWSSGAPSLVRTRNLRQDPRCSLFVIAPPPDPHWLGLETEVTLIDGPEAAELHVQLMTARHGGHTPHGMVMAHDDDLEHDRPFALDEYLTHVRAQRRLIYQFEILKAYGNC